MNYGNNLPQISDDNINLELSNVTQEILDSKDPGNEKILIDKFNYFINKKHLLRMLKLCGLLDNISDEMIRRFEISPGNFSSDELISMMNSVQIAMEKASKSMKGQEEMPIINLKQENTTINILDNFDKDSKERIADAIKSILSQAGQEKNPTTFESTYEQIEDTSNND